MDVGSGNGVKVGHRVAVARDIRSRLGGPLLVRETLVDDRKLAVGIHAKEIVLFWGSGLEVTPVEIIEGIVGPKIVAVPLHTGRYPLGRLGGWPYLGLSPLREITSPLHGWDIPIHGCCERVC